MTGTLQPLDQKFPIVDSEGRPTLYFTQWAQQKQIDIGEGITAEQAQELIDTWAAARQIIAGRALDGGGFLSNDVTIDHAESLVVPGTYGDATHVPRFVVDQEGHVQGVTLVAISSGGGGLPWYYKAPLKANFGTIYAALRSGSIVTAPPILSDDAHTGFGFKTQADTGTFTEKLFGRAIPLANQGANFTITVHLKANLRLANDQVGIWAGDTATNKYVLFGLFCRGANTNLQRAFYNAGTWNDGTFSANWNGQDVWLRLVIVNQTTSYYVSADGVNFDLVYAAENLFAASYKNYGFYLGSAVADVFAASCDYLASDEYP